MAQPYGTTDSDYRLKTTHAADAGAAVQGLRPVQSTIKELERNIECIEKALAVLNERLLPVLRKLDPKNLDEKRPNAFPTEACDIEHKLLSSIYRLQTLKNEIDLLHELIEV